MEDEWKAFERVDEKKNAAVDTGYGERTGIELQRRLLNFQRIKNSFEK